VPVKLIAPGLGDSMADNRTNIRIVSNHGDVMNAHCLHFFCFLKWLARCFAVIQTGHGPKG
jgi:hypothetical protein